MAGVDEAGPRPAGRPGGGRGSDPGRRQAHPRPGRFQGAHTAAARPAVRPDLREGAVLLGGAGQRRGDRHAQHPARDHAGDEARGGGPAPQACQGAGGRQPPAPDRRAGRSRDRRRRQDQVDFRRFHPGQGAPRPAVRNAARGISRSTASPPTRATARPSTWRRCECTAPAATTGDSSVRSRPRSRSRTRTASRSPSRVS